jgi:hypothetical protein
VYRLTGIPWQLAETEVIGGIIMERSRLVDAIDLGIRYAVLGFMFIGGIIALVPLH